MAIVAVILFAIVAALLPLSIPQSHFVWRTIAGYLAIGSLLRFIEVMRDPAAFRLHERVAIVLFLTDPRKVRRVPRSLALRRWRDALALGALGTSMLGAAHALADGAGPFGSPREVARAALGALGLLSLSEGAQRLFDAAAALFGIAVAPVHVAPSRSASLADFWGRRWNLVVGGWLRAHVYAPLARRGLPAAGVILAFAASALIHLYPTFVAIGAGAAAAIAAFFVAHGALLLIEARLRVRRRRRLVRTAYVYGAFALTAPLFVEPFLRSIGL